MEKPILFSTPMVKTILENRKSKTRRLNALAEINKNPDDWHFREFSFNTKMHRLQAVFENINQKLKFITLPWEDGDILWVRETWADLRGMGFGNEPQTDKPWNFAYKADIKPGSDSDRSRLDYGVKWKPSIHMPKEAARIFLKVKNVRVERLQEITEEDAVNEGVKAYGPNNCSGTSARIAFAELWDSLLPKPNNKFKRNMNSWADNPWVWVIEFERVK